MPHCAPVCRRPTDIARFTAEDPAAGLPDVDDLLLEPAPDLDLFHPWALDAAQAAEIALRCEAAALATDRRISNSEGAAVSAQQSHFFAGNSRGFRGGYASSRHSISVAPIAGRGAGMQRDSWYSSMRDAAELAAPRSRGPLRRGARAVAPEGAPRCHRRVAGAVRVHRGRRSAWRLGAGDQRRRALYRKASFLEGSLGTAVLASHIDIDEDPFVPKGKGSSAFDEEGVRTRKRRLVDGGRLQGYFLSSYSARKLGMKTTGHAGGSHNLIMTSRATAPGDSLAVMLKRLHRGLFVTELMGQGVNYVTGDYSRGASGYWVENGEIAFAVEEGGRLPAI